MTTWGESHGPAIGVVIDGCPAGLPLNENMINSALKKRAPGQSPYTSPRKETDKATLLSGVFENQTTGTPISILIPNNDTRKKHYSPIKHLLRPGHANFSYLEKYGIFDYRGGGRASARETASRVAAGAVAAQLLATQKITVHSYLTQIGDLKAANISSESTLLANTIDNSALFWPEPTGDEKLMHHLNNIVATGDSVGGIVEFRIDNVPAGLGDPIYEKLEANLAKAMLSLPATKGIELGEGFKCVQLTGSQHNDHFCAQSDAPMATNHAGGTLGGISTGMPIIGRVAFKPTSSIKKTQPTVDTKGNQADFTLPEGSRHDPCVAIRAVPVVKAMCQLVLADAYLMSLSSKIKP